MAFYTILQGFEPKTATKKENGNKNTKQPLECFHSRLPIRIRRNRFRFRFRFRRSSVSKDTRARHFLNVSYHFISVISRSYWHSGRFIQTIISQTILLFSQDIKGRQTPLLLHSDSFILRSIIDIMASFVCVFLSYKYIL